MRKMPISSAAASTPRNARGSSRAARRRHRFARACAQQRQRTTHIDRQGSLGMNAPVKNVRRLESYIAGEWVRGTGEAVPLRDAATGEEVALIDASGIDLRT